MQTWEEEEDNLTGTYQPAGSTKQETLTSKLTAGNLKQTPPMPSKKAIPITSSSKQEVSSSSSKALPCERCHEHGSKALGTARIEFSGTGLCTCCYMHMCKVEGITPYVDARTVREQRGQQKVYENSESNPVEDHDKDEVDRDVETVECLGPEKLATVTWFSGSKKSSDEHEPIKEM